MGRKIPVRALSIKQPWAYAILTLGKDVENRTWWTPYRGDLVIHAPKTHAGLDAWMAITEIIDPEITMDLEYLPDDPLADVLGAIVGVVELVDVVQRHQGSRWAEPPDSRGRPYHWLLRNPRILARPIPARGYQSLWEPMAEDLAEIGRQLQGSPEHLGARRGAQLSLFQEAGA